MNKALLIGLGLCVSSISSLQAAPLMNNLKNHAFSPKVGEESQFTDFTGVWTSPNCQGRELTVSIKNDETTFSINEDEMSIGSMQTKGTSGKKSMFDLMTESSIRSVEWNHDKTQIIIKEVDVEKAFDIQETKDADVDTSMIIEVENLNFALENDTLKVKFNSVTYKDLQKIDSSHPTCTFTKVTQAK